VRPDDVAASEFSDLTDRIPVFLRVLGIPYAQQAKEEARRIRGKMLHRIELCNQAERLFQQFETALRTRPGRNECPLDQRTHFNVDQAVVSRFCTESRVRFGDTDVSSRNINSSQLLQYPGLARSALRIRQFLHQFQSMLENLSGRQGFKPLPTLIRS
jgi:hypothetical protein